MSDVTIVGGGPWGVALGRAASRAGARVTMFTRKRVDALEGLPVTNDPRAATKARLLVVAVPSTAIRDAAAHLGPHLDGSHVVVHGVRGLDRERLATVSDLIREETPARRLGALGGPVQPDELSDGRPSCMVCGSRFPEVIAAVTQAFQSSTLRIASTPDLRGLEWASALVGCLSVAVGFATQAGSGPGLLAALISRGVDEAARLAVAAGAEDRTMFGLGGYGDLLASIALADRPEVVLGMALARGASLEQAVAEAKLRVEAIDLIPRVAAFARDRKVATVTFPALEDMLQHVPAASVLEKLCR